MNKRRNCDKTNTKHSVSMWDRALDVSHSDNYILGNKPFGFNKARLANSGMFEGVIENLLKNDTSAPWEEDCDHYLVNKRITKSDNEKKTSKEIMELENQLNKTTNEPLDFLAKEESWLSLMASVDDTLSEDFTINKISTTS